MNTKNTKHPQAEFSVCPLSNDAQLSDGQREPVFIVGMNGSGTTMLLDCLAQHSSLFGFPRETRVIPYLMSASEKFEPLADDDNFVRLWNHIVTRMPFRLANNDKPMPLPDGWQSCPRTLAGALDLLFLCFAQREGKVRWCEKSPQYALHMSELKVLFPGARFIHVIRDGRDCAYSFNRRWRRTPELTIYRWKRLIARARQQSQVLGDDYMEMRYEELTSQPESSMREICEFLGIEFEPAILLSSAPYLDGMERSRTNARVGLRVNSEKWRGFFTAKQINRLERIAGEQLTECGYSSDQPGSDDSPSSAKRRFWEIKDMLFQFSREVVMKLSGRISRPWSTILGRPLQTLNIRSAGKRQ